jgi:arginine/ornithine transport system substrate-binding protein
MLRRSLAAVAALAVLTALSSNAAFAQGAKKLRIGVEGAYPPFSEVGADGKLKGFEIDLAYAYCKQMQRECELVQQEFDALIPALQSRKVDAIIASVSITDERKKSIAFSKPYLASPAAFIAKSGAPPMCRRPRSRARRSACSRPPPSRSTSTRSTRPAR